MAAHPPEPQTAPNAPATAACLNCGAPLAGRFCAQCGQRHVSRPLSLRAVIMEFIEEALNVDSRVVRSVRLLLFRPGRLTNEYLTGRRARYVSPWRLYLASSVLMFLALSWSVPPTPDPNDAMRPQAVRAAPGDGRVALSWKGAPAAQTYRVKRADTPSGPYTVLATGLSATHYMDATARNGQRYAYAVTGVSAEGRRAVSASVQAQPAANPKDRHASVSPDAPPAPRVSTNLNIQSGDTDVDALPDTEEEYTALQSALPEARRDTVFEHMVRRRAIHLRNAGVDRLRYTLMSAFLENAPKGMFVLLPLFALLLRVFFARRGRLYLEHLVFAIHCHSFVYLVIALNVVVKQPALAWFSVAAVALYLFKATRNVYRPSVLGTAVSLGFLSVSYMVLLTVTLLMVVLATVFTS